MRVKVECGPPLPAIKAWFIVPPVSTVYDFKETLCKEFSSLSDAQTTPKNIALYLDGFELLDATFIDVVRDGDLITVKGHAVPNVKRKPEDGDSGTPRKKQRYHSAKSCPTQRTSNDSTTRQGSAPQKGAVPRKVDPRSQSTFNISSDSSSKTESDTSESSSESDSDSDSSDSSTSSTSSGSSEASSTSSGLSTSLGVSSTSSIPSIHASTSTLPQPIGAKTTPDAQPAIVDRQAPAFKSSVGNFVPPGHGKTSTHSRNLRRRRKKQFERMADQTESANANDIPLGSRSTNSLQSSIEAPPSSSEQEPTEQPVQRAIMMASLSNKNKRKGFKQAMAGKIPKKIVFSTPGGDIDSVIPQEEYLPFATASTPEIRKGLPDLYSRLVPPSALQEQGLLPPNMFVTSIDVEEGMQRSRRKGKSKGTQAEAETEHDAVQVEEQVVLDYGDPEDSIPSQREPQKSPSTDILNEHRTTLNQHYDWTAVEGKWGLLSKVASKSQVLPGAVLSWKALAINPRTFTPEFLLNIGRVTNCSERLSIQPIYRPGAIEVSFGGYQEDELAASLEEETYEWGDVFAGDWRVVS